MSADFELFLKEYHATGREKLDGYSLANLDRLTSDERIKVVHLLQEEAPKFSGAFEPLAHLDPQLAISIIKKIEHDLPNREFRAAYVVYYWLYKLTRDDSYAKKFCDSRKYLVDDKYGASVIPFYAHASRLVDSPIVEAALKASIFTETNETGLSTAARALLNKYGYSRENPSKKDQYLSMWKILTEGTPQQKKAVLAQLPPIAIT